MNFHQYWNNIILPPQEHDKFFEVLEILTSASSEEQNVRIGEILGSEEFSFDAKRKLAFNLNYMKPLCLWACANFEGEDLWQMTRFLNSNGFEGVGHKEISALVSNPHFIVSTSVEYNTLRFLYVAFSSGNVRQAEKSRWLLQEIIDQGVMSLDIATEFIESSDPWNGDPWSDTLIAWTRKAYDLEDVPEAWVVKFLAPSGENHD